MLIELCAELRKLEATHDVPIVLLSDQPAAEDLVARALLAGMARSRPVHRSVGP